MTKKRLLRWDREDASVDGIEAEMFFTEDGREGFLFADSEDARFVDLEFLTWNMLHSLHDDQSDGIKVDLDNHGLVKTFCIPDCEFSRNTVKLFRYCNEKQSDEPADFHAGVLRGLIQRDFMEHERLSGLSMRCNGALVGAANKSRLKDPGKDSLLAVLKSTQPKFAGQKQTAIEKAMGLLGIKSYTTMMKYIRHHEIRDTDWLMQEE